MPWNWMPSKSILRETMGRRRRVAQVMRPVRPRPPMVAANQSGSCVGEQRRREPSERTSSNWVMWQPKVPATWWFLPWMSLAMAPPRVTYLVPGVTGRKKPRGTAEVENLGEGDAGFGGEEAGGRVEMDETVHAGGDDEVAVFEQAGIAVGAAHAYGEGSVVEAGDVGGEVGLPVLGDEVGGIMRVATPGFEGVGEGGLGFLRAGHVR